MKPKPLEKDIVSAILQYLETIHAVAGKTKTMGVKRGKAYCYDKYCFRGFPDLTVFYNNQLYFVEAKRPGEKQSDEQILFESHCVKAGIPYILADDVSVVVQRINPRGIMPLRKEVV